MKKNYLVLVSLLCFASTSFLHSSEKEFQRRAQIAMRKLPKAEQIKVEEILAKDQAGEQLSDNEIEFLTEIDNKLYAIIAKDKLAEEQELDRIKQDKLDQARVRKEQAQVKLAEFRSQPQGPCPYDENDTHYLINILDAIIDLDKELALQDEKHSSLETVLACNDAEYTATSSATSPYKAMKPIFDGTIVTLYLAGKEIFIAKQPKRIANTFRVKLNKHQADSDSYEIILDAKTTCDNLDEKTKPAHNKLAKIIYDINKKQKKTSESIKGKLEVTPYGGLFTRCADAQARIVCTKELLTYLVKKQPAKPAQQRSWLDWGYQPIVAVYNFTHSTSPEYEAMQAQAAKNQAERKEEIRQEKQQNDTEIDRPASDLQQLQQEEISKAS